MVPDALFRPGLELMTYLDGNISSNGLDDPALDLRVHLLPWWTRATPPPANPSSYLSLTTIKSALNHYRQQLEAANIPLGPPHRIRTLAEELNKPAYTWHSSVNDHLPDVPSCTRCRLYRSVGLGVMDRVRDTFNMVHACEMASQAEKDIAIRRASGFNELFETALNKECHQAETQPDPDPELVSNMNVENAEDPRFRPTTVKLKTMLKGLLMGLGSAKWTWGVDLTHDDLRELIRGADRPQEDIHSGYDQDFPSTLLESETSDHIGLEDPDDQDVRFEDLSGSIAAIPELLPHDIPAYPACLIHPLEDVIDSEPDPVIEALTQRAKAELTKRRKLLMQEEVDQPSSYFDSASEFIPQITLIPRRPWLAPRLPIVLPPTNPFINQTDQVKSTDPDSDSEIPDHIHIPDSDDIPDHIHIPDSPALHIIPESESGPSKQYFTNSDDNLDDAMDVVVSDDEGKMMIPDDSDSDSIPDHIHLSSESSMGMKQSVEGLDGTNTDVKTGRFTAESFAHLPDDFLA